MTHRHPWDQLYVRRGILTIVSLSDFAPQKHTRFALYRAPSNDAGDGTSSEATLDDRLLLEGSTDVMQYTSTNWGWGASAQAAADLRRETRGYTGDYLIGAYDKEKKQVTFRVAPLFTLNRSVKSLAHLSASATEHGARDNMDYTRARRDLGEAFGNKKQKQAARNLDRMKVNTENMDGILEHVASGIDVSASSLPTDLELNATLNTSRALPQAHLDASEPADVYPLASLVPPTVLNALHTRHLLKCSSQSDLAKALRLTSSPWLLPRMWQIVQTAQNDAGMSRAMELVRVGYYVAILLAFRKHARGLSRGDDGVSQVAHKMRLPEHEKDIVMEHLVSQYAEQARSSHRYAMTAIGDTRLFASIVVLALHLEEFSLASDVLAQELCVTTQRVNEILRSLGCTSSQSTKHGVDGDGAASQQQQRKWHLRLPLSFPNQRKRGPARR